MARNGHFSQKLTNLPEMPEMAILPLPERGPETQKMMIFHGFPDPQGGPVASLTTKGNLAWWPTSMRVTVRHRGAAAAWHRGQQRGVPAMSAGWHR